MGNRRLELNRELLREEYKPFFEGLRNDEIFGRLGKVFATPSSFFFLDTGTGQIFKLEKDTYEVLKVWLETDKFESALLLKLTDSELARSIKTIKEGVETYSILKAPVLTKKNVASPDYQALKYAITNEMSSVTLEVTEKCNLRCKYCIYHPSHPEYREFGKRNMSIDVAKEAISMLFDYSSNSGERYVGFYGGEPMMNWKLINQSIEFAKEKTKESGKEIQFSMTTNATLINDKIADYLIGETNMYITISLDGPKDIHNKNRIFLNNKGSFDKTIKGLKTLIKSCETHNECPEERLSINMVLDNCNEKQFFNIQDFFSTTEWFPQNITIQTNNVDYGRHSSDYVVPQSDEERSLLNHELEVVSPVLNWSRNNMKDPIFTKGSLDEGLARIHNRFFLNSPAEKYGMNGCCIPGVRRVYVTVDGDYYACEKIAESPKLGDVNCGFDFKKIEEKYFDDFVEGMEHTCKNCWALNMCGLCYTNTMDESGINLSYRNESCLAERYYLEQFLIMYHTILEEEGLEVLRYLDTIEMN